MGQDASKSDEGTEPMAQFKEVTLIGGEKVTINMDRVVAMKRVSEKETTIHFSKNYWLHVEETPNEILMRNPLHYM
jgi:hypothetical protein